jgi:hypothetical protein
VDAVGLSIVDPAKPLTTDKVLSLCHRLKVCGVDAQAVAAEMVDD